MTSRPPLELQISTLLTGTGITLACAESCTGGLVAWRITSVAGSSDYFLGSIVAYSNGLKQQLLGVSRETLEQRGAVSEECAREMAEGVRVRTGATIAVSTTGIAGPGGATARKPVGLIYFACATADETVVHEVRWDGDRQSNMTDAADFALQLIVKSAEQMQAR